MKLSARIYPAPRSEDGRGFALVMTLALLSILVMAVFVLSALARVNSRIASAALQQTQAQQNALLALNVALGELQRVAGPDARITGMAGVAGMAAQNTFRQWTGIWGGSPSPVWLVSGGSLSLVPSVVGPRLVIVGSHSVGAPVNTTDQEPVEVGLIDLPGIDAFGLSIKTGRIGYWVGDEGVKVSAIIADDELQFSGVAGVGLRPNFRNLIGAAFNPTVDHSRILSLEQLKMAVSGFSLPAAFHSLNRTHRALPVTAGAGVSGPGGYVFGAFNINTTSESAWRALLEFPDSNNSVFGLNAARTLSAARQVRDRVAARGRPFGSVDEFLNSNIIQDSFDMASPRVISVTQTDFIAELRPILTIRSDTFRIRAYGDALDAADHTNVRASAYCEAIVQRTPEPAPNALGRRFIVTYFRWLGRDDI